MSELVKRIRVAGFSRRQTGKPDEELPSCQPITTVFDRRPRSFVDAGAFGER
jgi:hypothetical protein